MDEQKTNPGVAVMPPPVPTHRHPDDPGFKMRSNFGFGEKAIQPQYVVTGRCTTTIRGHDGECLVVIRSGGQVRIVPTGMDYSLADEIERLVDRFWS
jgi:hypothetical protein